MTLIAKNICIGDILPMQMISRNTERSMRTRQRIRGPFQHLDLVNAAMIDEMWRTSCLLPISLGVRFAPQYSLSSV